MADREFIVDIILRARDETAAAFAAAVGHQEAFNALQKESQRDADDTARAYDEMSKRVSISQERLRTEQKALTDEVVAGSKARRDAIDSQVALEGASQRYVRVLNDTKSSEAERTQALQRLRAAHDDYALSLTKLGDAEAKQADNADKATARRVAAMNVEGERRRQLTATYAEAAKQDAAEDDRRTKQRLSNERAVADTVKALEGEIAKARTDRQRQLDAADKKEHSDRLARIKAESVAENELAKLRQARAREDQQAGRAEQQRLRDTAGEYKRLETQMRNAAQQLSKEKLTPADFDKSRNDIIRARSEMTRLGIDGQTSMRAVRKALDDAGASTSNFRREILAAEHGQRQLETAQKSLISQTKEYAREIDNLAKLQRQRSEAGASGADVQGLHVLDREIELARARLTTLAAEIKAVSSEGVKIGVDVDTGAAIHQLVDFETVKEAVGRDIHLNVDVDIGAALAKIEAFQAAAHHGMRGNDADISWWQQFTDSIQQSSNRVATFDNFIRGLVSLGIGVFFNQIIVLAGAAAGALTALAGSAIYAGGALGGALVSGIAQALPVLGLFAVALNRITAVWKAAQQQQLLQQQTFARHDKMAKQSADATDAIKNAEDQLAAAHRRVADAQKGVTDAREKAIRQLQDLILQERQAQLAAKGATLSLAESQDALRQAIAQGNTGDIARARLNVQEAQLGVRQAGVTSSRTSQDLATRQRQGISGSPEVTQAKEQLVTARQAAEQAQRSLEKAGRTADNTGTDALAAAGKLNFMVSQLSGAEKKLYTEFTTFIDRFRVQGGKMVEPIIGSVAHLMKRVNTLLLDPELLASAKKLSGAIGGQLNRIFDHFTNSKGIKVFEQFATEAGHNLKPVTDIIINLANAFTGIAKAAEPALRTFLKYFGNVTKQFADWANSVKGQKALKTFFDEGARQFKLWMGLLGSLSRLILDVINPKVGGGAKTGAHLLEDMTGALDRLDRAARSKEGRKFLQNFFETSREALKALKPVLIAVGEQFARLFNKDGVANIKAAGTVISQILLPAFGDFLAVMGLLMRVLSIFLKIPFAGQMMRIAISAAATATVLGKLHTIFTPFTAFLKAMPMAFEALGTKIFGAGMFLEKFGGVIGKLGVVFQRFGAFIIEQLAPKIAAAVTFMFGPWGLVIAGVVILLAVLEAKFHIFEKLWTLIKEGASIAWHAVADAFSAIVKWVSRAVTDVLNWLKSHWKLAVFFAGPIGIVVGLFVNFGPRVLRALESGFNAVWGWLKKLPGRIGDFAGSAADALVSAFEGVGERILKGILRGLKGLGSFAKDLANAFVDLLNALIPNKIPVPGAPDIPLPKNPIPHLATGGYIGGNYGEGDKYTVKVAGEEAILNPIQQAILGKDKIMAVLRATGGQFLRPGGSYAVGAAPGGAGFAPNAATTSLSINVSADTGGLAHKWRLMWDEITSSTRRNAQNVEQRIRDMRVAVDGTLDKLKDQSAGHFVDIEMSSKTHFTRMVNAATSSFTSLATIVYKAFRYIGNSTNDVLRTLDADPVKFSLDTPNIGRAAEGYIGMPGERGADGIPIMVGRGEAVLNWAHQKMIEPALQAFYGMGLQDLFKRSHAYHAGGHNSLGFAKGGLTGPFGSGAAFTAVTNFAKRKFGLSMTAGRTNHSHNTAYGNTSDHSWGGAGDFSNGYNTPQENAFNRFWKTKLPNVVKQLIWQGKDQLRGFPIYDHFDHVHVALQRQYAFDAKRMARLISRAMRGLSVSDLLTKTSGDDTGVEHIDAVKVRGKNSPWKSIMQKVINKVRSAANSKIDDVFGQSAPGGTGGAVPHFTGPWVDVMGKIAKKYGWNLRDWSWLVNAESSGDPTAVNKGSGAFGLGQFLGATKEAYAKLGATSTNPVKQIEAMAAYIRDRYGNPTKAKGWHLAHNWYSGGGRVPALARFAQGGFVGGMRRAATGVPGLMQGTRTPGGVYTAPQLLPIDLAGTESEFRRAYNGIAKALSNVRKSGKGMSAIVANLTQVTKENGLLDQIGVALTRYSDNLALKLKEATFKMSKAGVVIQQLTPAQQAEAQINNMRDVLRKYRGNLDRINQSIGKNAAALKDVNKHIDEITAIDPDKRTKKQRDELKKLTTEKGDLTGSARNLRDRALKARGDIADQLAALFQAQLDAFQKKTDEAVANVSSGGLNQRQNQLQQRVATALGDQKWLQTLQTGNIDILRGQAAKLQEAAKAAQAHGYTDLAAQYQQQFEETQASIQEAISQQLQGQIDAVNNAAQRSVASAQRKTDLAGVLDRIGGSNAGQAITSALGYDPFGGQSAAQLRTQGLQQQGEAYMQQRQGLQGALLTAQREGNVGQIQSLTDQLADLDKTIADNIVAQRENTTAIRQSAIDAITSRGSFQGGVYGGLVGLTQAHFQAHPGESPDDFHDRQESLLKQQGGTIEETLFGLQDKLKDFGVDLGNTTGDQLVDKLKGLNFDSIETNLSPTDKAQFESLISSIIDNGTQLENNTDQLHQLNGQLTPQDWQSTAWSWFRSAIFTGMGDVLPSYSVPSFDGGGSVLRTGMAKLHAGEYVAAAKGPLGSTNEGDINIEINEAGGEPDVNYLAKRIAFERRTARATR